MRWRFLDETDPQQREFRDEMLSRIDQWWAAFVPQAERLDKLFKGQEQFDLAGWMHDHLGRISPDLQWEFGPSVHGDGHRLVITPESERGLRPLTDTILERAPKIEGWEFYPYRLPEDVEMAEQMVAARLEGNLQDWAVEVTLGESGLADLAYSSPHIAGSEDQQAFQAAIVATETLLGEDVLDHNIGVIEVNSEPTTGTASRSRTIPLSRLRDTVAAVIDSFIAQQPERPYFEWAHVGEHEWSMLKCEPAQAEDYPGWSDLFVAVTMTPQLWMAARRRPFCSRRYSRHGETFAYLKIDGAEGLEDSEFEDRGDIEDAINAVLGTQGAGCTIGGGTGLRYSYIELVLANLETAIDLLQGRLRGQLATRTWLLFHDSDWCDEWVGLYDHTPPPPIEIPDDDDESDSDY